MQAVVMATTGGPEVLQVQAVPIPHRLQERDLLIRLMAAGINPVDTKLRQRGTYFPDRMPAILGFDGAGVVETTGSAAHLFRPGDAVYFCADGLGQQPGTYGEYVVVDERFVAPKPRSLSFTAAAAAPLVLITAWEALFERANVRAGQRVLIHGGTGGVGHVAIQLAKLKGAVVCTTVSSEAKGVLAGRLGADYCIYYPRIDFVAAVRMWTQDLGVDVAFDTVGEPVFSQTFKAVRVYGDVVTLLAPTRDTDWKTARDRNLRISYELMLTPMLQHLTLVRQYQADILRQCAQWFDEGKLSIHVHRSFPLIDVAQAHRCLEAGDLMGKLVLLINED